MTETFVDTSFVIAVVNRRDQHHAEAVGLADLYDGEPLVTTEAVLFEIGNALAKRYRAEAVATIEDFLESAEVTVVRIDMGLFERGFDLYKTRMDKTWGFIDCLSFVVMKERGIVDALTTDDDFRQAGFNPLFQQRGTAERPACRPTAARERFLLNMKRHSWAAAAEAGRSA